MNDTFTSQFAFSQKNRFCLGVEEEVWTVSPQTGLLIPAAIQVFADPKRRYRRIKPELPAQQIEMVTPICRDLKQLDRALRSNERRMAKLAEEFGFEVSRSPVPTTPFVINVFPTERYLAIAAQQGERLRGAYVAGLHVHLGLGIKEEAIAVMNASRTLLPLFLAVSARSPIFAGTDTGYASYRYVQYKKMAGEVVPPYLESWEHFRSVAADRGFLDAPRNCWWAIRISIHGSVELRIPDLQEDQAMTMGIAALFRLVGRQAIERPGRVIRLPAEEIERLLEVAARGALGAKGLLRGFLSVAGAPGYEEELRCIARLLAPEEAVG